MNFEVIRDAVLGEGHYLGHAQTYARMKTDYLYPDIADRRSINDWQEAGAMDAREIARDKVRTLLAKHYPSHIPGGVDAELRDSYNIILPSERMRAGSGIW